MNLFLKSAVGLAVLALAGAASAQLAGDDIVSFGVARITQRVTVGQITSTNSTFQGLLSGATADTDGATTPTFGWLHMYTNNIGSELTLGIPPRIKLNINATAGGGGNHPDGAAATVYTPALVAKYFFLEPKSAFRPYVGLGATYVSFKDVYAGGDSTVATLAGNGAKIDDSWAPVYNLGVIYNINDRWSINTSISYIPIETKLTFVSSTATGSAVSSGTIKFDTTDYVVRVGYKF